MKLFRQIYSAGRGFVFRIALPGHRFISEEVYDTAEEAAFRCDVFKSYLVSTYGLTGNTMWRSLVPSRYLALLAEAGATPADVSVMLPFSCREYLANIGHEMLTEFSKAQAELKVAKGKYV